MRDAGRVLNVPWATVVTVPCTLSLEHVPPSTSLVNRSSRVAFRGLYDARMVSISAGVIASGILSCRIITMKGELDSLVLEVPVEEDEMTDDEN